MMNELSTMVLLGVFGLFPREFVVLVKKVTVVWKRVEKVEKKVNL